MPGLPEFFNALRAAGIGFVLATNNATKTATMYTERLAGFGVAIPPEFILTSAEATASYLAEHFEYGAPAYIVGDSGLREAVLAQGFRRVTPSQVRAGATAAFVVAGLSRDATYEDLAMGAHLINQGAPFIGTNPDATFPSELGPLPGSGAMLALLITATGVEPIIIGKPGPIIFLEAVKRLGAEPSTVAMVGDRLSTDIYGAKAAGLQAILLLSGISTLDDVDASTIKPDYIFADINELAQFLTRQPIIHG